MIISIVCLLISGCGADEKRLEAVKVAATRDASSTGIFDPKRTNTSPSDKASTVEVRILDTLATAEYLYMKVRSEGRTYWLSTLHQPIDMSKNYVHGPGHQLLDFYSKSFDRSFDTLYMVKGLVPADSAEQRLATTISDRSDQASPTGLTISRLVRNMEDYRDQSIVISGRVTKVNKDIMDRHWVHIIDGTMDDYDLVLTTQEDILVGDEVRMRGAVTLDKDFGAGYKYELIVEDAMFE